MNIKAWEVDKASLFGYKKDNVNNLSKNLTNYEKAIFTIRADHRCSNLY